jgi:hypothetical protein
MQDDQQLYQRFIGKWQEVTELPPQTVGVLTPVFKRLAPHFKSDPWRLIIPLSLVFILGVFWLIELNSSQVVSILQSSF